MDVAWKSGSAKILGEFRILTGDVEVEGMRFVWHDFKAADTFDWRALFNEDSLVVCLNLLGSARVPDWKEVPLLQENGLWICSGMGRNCTIERVGGQRHRYFAIEMRAEWLRQMVAAMPGALREPVKAFLAHDRRKPEFAAESMPESLRQLAGQMMNPPVGGTASGMWFRGKLLEALSYSLFEPEGMEFFCERTRRVARERASRVQEILLADIEHPPSLAELGRSVGCSPYYLSRIFRQETGITISQFLRKSRLEEAARLLSSGKANVTEAAMAVGYSSLSHFSKAFAGRFGCCPCVYGLHPE